MTPYVSLPASLLITNKTPKQSITDEFQTKINADFETTWNAYAIEEEYPTGSGVYRNITVRIDNGINIGTGAKLGDDHKLILFQDLTHSSELGEYYRFDNNYWIVVNTQNIKNLAASALVRRCNNMLRWIGNDGALNEIPCYIDYDIKENKDYSTAGSALVLPSGFIEITVQLNNKTNFIEHNRRFLLGKPGNWTSYKVLGGGINNFNNLATTSNTISGLLTISASTVQMNETTDDLVNGIPDVGQYEYAVVINNDSISGQATNAYQLTARVTLNEETVSRSVTWSSSNTNIATVNSSGLVTMVATGSCTITCQLQNNASIFDTCSVTVNTTPIDEYEIIVSPNKNYVLQGTTQAFNVYLYHNNVQQADTFTFSVVNSIPSDRYAFTVVNDNSFMIQNMKYYPNETLQVNCVSGIHSKVIEIWLKGSW